MSSRKVLAARIVGIGLMIFGVIFGVTIKKLGFCPGDKALFLLGLPAWTNGTSGTHYSAIIGLIFIVMGAFAVCLTLQKNK